MFVGGNSKTTPLTILKFHLVISSGFEDNRKSEIKTFFIAPVFQNTGTFVYTFLVFWAKGFGTSHGNTKIKTTEYKEPKIELTYQKNVLLKKNTFLDHIEHVHILGCMLTSDKDVPVNCEK